MIKSLKEKLVLWNEWIKRTNIQQDWHKKREETVSRMKQEIITTDPAGIKRIIREYYEQLYMHTLDNLDDKNQFLEKHTLPQLI